MDAAFHKLFSGKKRINNNNQCKHIKLFLSKTYSQLYSITTMSSSANLPSLYLTSSRVHLCLQLVHSALQTLIDLHHTIGLFLAGLHSHLKLSFHLLTGAARQCGQEGVGCLSLVAWETTEGKRALDLICGLLHLLSKCFCLHIPCFKQGELLLVLGWCWGWFEVGSTWKPLKILFTLP